MKKLSFFIVILLFALVSCKKNNNVTPNNPDNPSNPTQQPMTLRGADLSYLPEIEQAGTVFYDSTGTATDPLTLFKDNGCNTVRLRLWYQPSTVHSSFSEVKDFASTIRNAGLKVWLDIQYSDTWTDQGHQAKPAAWANLSSSVLEDSVYEYTKRVVGAIQPDYVQIGNEINDGLLWNDGKVNNTSTFVALLDKGIQGARSADPSTQIIIHFAGYQGAFWFYRLLQSNNVNYDIIGLSYYPWWHGKDLNVMEDSISRLSSTFNKKVVLAEIAYPFTLKWNDWTNNIVGEQSQLIPQYPASPDGQKSYLLALRQVLSQNSNNLGFCYWEPDWVAFRGSQATDGSTWENLTLFDFNNKALPGMAVFNK